MDTLPYPPLQDASQEDVTVLAKRDPDLGHIIATYGMPPLWVRAEGFSTLIHIILEQQVSLAAAKAAFDRLVQAVDLLTPARFLTCTAAMLKEVGFSRQKAAYGRALAEAICAGDLPLAHLSEMSDEAARTQLMGIKGIGPWTADVYLLMALRRRDIWPIGDLALALSCQRVKGWVKRPSPTALEAIGEAWRPCRSAAARLLWHHYLCTRRGSRLSAPDRQHKG